MGLNQMTPTDNDSGKPSFFIERTLQIAKLNIDDGGRPFACVIVDPVTNIILSETGNHVAQTCDPTAHAEVLGIRLAAEERKRQSNHITVKSLYGLDFYIMASPCAMCYGAMCLSAPHSITFITTREDYSVYYSDPRKYFLFNDFYEQISKEFHQRRLPTKHFSEPRLKTKALEILQLWKDDLNMKPTIEHIDCHDEDLTIRWFNRVLNLARDNVLLHKGRPFACVITRGNELIAESADQVDQLGDPTAHAEMQAIRIASQKLHNEHMFDLQIYSLVMPSPMSLGAMYYCSPSQLTFLLHPSEYESIYLQPAAPKIPKLLDFYAEYGRKNENRIVKMNQIDNDIARKQGLEIYRRWKEINIDNQQKN
ncbi:hypothetical protein I4U23_012141 [Adineta vaga]|nr:hypothetical protein I4U23_012141 [Adineta vaga]